MILHVERAKPDHVIGLLFLVEFLLPSGALNSLSKQSSKIELYDNSSYPIQQWLVNPMESDSLWSLGLFGRGYEPRLDRLEDTSTAPVYISLESSCSDC